MHLNPAKSATQRVLARRRLVPYAILLACFWAACAAAQEDRQATKPDLQKTDVLRLLSTSFEELSQRSGRAVVQIFVHSYVAADDSNASSGLLATENSSGSGIIMSPDGYILTNAHVVKGAHNIRVQLNVRAEAERREHQRDNVNRPLSGTLIGIDRGTDLAVIKIKKSNLPYLQFGDSNMLRQGQLVLALGNPLGLDNSVSLGVISAVARQIKPDDTMVYIQTDAPINPGNSGGPLVDADGRVMGISTFIYSQSGGSEGIGFAIPSNIAKQVYTQLKTQGHVHRARLGIVLETITPDMAEGLSLETDHGVIVSDVEPDGPAAHAGIKPDDIIIALNGRRMYSVHQVDANIFRLAPDTRVTIRVQRGTGQLDVPVIAEEEPMSGLDALADAVDPEKNLVSELGIVGLDVNKTLLELIPDLRRPSGIVVAARNASAPYSGPPLETGDVIYAVNRQVVANIAELRQLLERMKHGEAAVLLIERQGKLRYLALELD